jgi:hypothetical protein
LWFGNRYYSQAALDFYTLCGHQALGESSVFSGNPPRSISPHRENDFSKGQHSLKNLFNDSGGYGKINKGGEETGLRNIPWR